MNDEWLQHIDVLSHFSIITMTLLTGLTLENDDDNVTALLS